ncbi:hypothetical protein JXJ21_07120 [candidate division KSB1 bacterium]|nr:hypothetical protein [candidate division KSB1 bacterium]
MKKIAYVCFMLLVVQLQPGFSQQQEDWGIASQLFYQRYYDRVFDLNFQNTTARSLGIGNAFLSIADNLDAISWNPAGLASLPHPEANLVGQFNFDMRDYFAPNFSGQKILSEVSPQLIYRSAALAWPFSFGRLKIAAGLSYRFLYNFSNKFNETQYFYGGGLFREEKALSGGPQAVSASFALSIIPQVSVGLTYNHILGSSKYDLQIKSPWADNRIYFGFDDEEEYSGSFLDIGILLKPIRFVSVGLAVTPGWAYTINEKSEQFRINDYDYELGWVEAIYETSPEYLNEYKIDIPLIYRAGIAIHPLRKLTLTGSYESIKWEDLKITRDGNEHPNYLVNVETIKAGVEYRISYGLWTVPLRIGYYTDDLPYKDKWFENAYLGDQIKRAFYTLGMGIYRGHYAIDFAFQYGVQNYKWWMRQADYYNGRLYETEDSMNQAVFSFGYRL